MESSSRVGVKRNSNDNSNTTTTSNASTYLIEDTETQRTSWLVPMFVVANIALFIVVMYLNDYPNRKHTRLVGKCVVTFLGRFSFDPVNVNPLFGPSSSTSVLSSLFIRNNISVGTSGALFGLLGAMLSELVTNWTIYTNKAMAMLTLMVIIVINLAIGILPHVDNFAHIGGFLTGFLLGFVLLPRPQFWWLERRNLPAGIRSKSKYKPYQYVLWVVSVVLLVSGFSVALVMLFR
ncbi:hypothetical protein F3Y22_tig00111843pilonHSYRG00005 [Hibiscus syriacus]|uniref:RHOMBOID-like protein n=1 Tax=Hibiscus syriacus TaxID=106335 RepID=A0A6A2XA10_HIBSY|nr:hypothetical protein F3Y22_tig00111843pilonHSYRG00005 [Hibiscus syriacus]